ncbi:hypothetical protein [Salinicoccus sp. CNSTN-B1]
MDKVKLATADFSKEMAKWAAWYMAVMVALYILLMLFIDDSGINGMSFFFMASGPTAYSCWWQAFLQSSCFWSVQSSLD